MTKEVIVSICGLQSGPETDGEPIEMITAGEYFYKNGKHYLLYEESIEGESAVNKNRIKFMPGYMELHKTGIVNVHMVFEEYKKNMANYAIPFGSFAMGIDTKSVKIEEKEDLIEVKAEYVLELNEEYVADCDIKITVTPKGKFSLS